MESLNASLAPDDEMADRMIGDYQNAEVMIFGEAPSIDTILASTGSLEDQLNQA